MNKDSATDINCKNEVLWHFIVKINNFAITPITLDIRLNCFPYVATHDNTSSCLILKGTFQRADNWSSGIWKKNIKLVLLIHMWGFQEDQKFVRLNIAGNSLNAFCPSPQCLCRNDLEIQAAMSWFRTKTLITIKPLPWQTFPVIFMKTSAITGTQASQFSQKTTLWFSGQSFSFWVCI